MPNWRGTSWDFVITRMLVNLGKLSETERQLALDGDEIMQAKVIHLQKEQNRKALDFPEGLAEMTAKIPRDSNESPDHYQMRMLVAELKPLLAFSPKIMAARDWENLLGRYTTAITEAKRLLQRHPEYWNEFGVLLNDEIFPRPK